MSSFVFTRYCKSDQVEDSVIEYNVSKQGRRNRGGGQRGHGSPTFWQAMQSALSESKNAPSKSIK